MKSRAAKSSADFARRSGCAAPRLHSNRGTLSDATDEANPEGQRLPPLPYREVREGDESPRSRFDRDERPAANARSDEMDATNRPLLLRASRHEFADLVEGRRGRLPGSHRSENDHVLAARNARPPQLPRRRRASEALFESTRNGRREDQGEKPWPPILRMASGTLTR